MTSRIMVAIQRFGISPRKFENLLKKYYALSRMPNSAPTLAITSVTLSRHPNVIKELSRHGVEFAMHGYMHIDYTTVSADEQRRHFQKAIEVFKTNGISSCGFRAPYLRVNGHTHKILSSLGFLYDSSSVIHWDVINLKKYSKRLRGEYNRLIEFYHPRNAEKYFALPRSSDGLIEIPVSIPDDEVMVDRLGIKDVREIGNVWRAILEQTYSRGELFTLQLHPERISICENALADIIQRAKGFAPPIWIAQLREINEWWQERKIFRFHLNDEGNCKYGIKADCSDRATLLLKNLKVNVPVNEWLDGYQSVKARGFILESPKRPAIGVGQDSSPAAINFLSDQGFIVERSNEPQEYGLYLNNLAKFDEADEKPLYREIEQSNAPLLRYWRWPDQARSALAITGDIDSMTLIDFVLRIIENWRQNRSA